jgi:signal transduction histidine kinase
MTEPDVPQRIPRPGWLRRFAAAHPRLMDWLAVAVVVGVGLLQVLSMAGPRPAEEAAGASQAAIDAGFQVEVRGVDGALAPIPLGVDWAWLALPLMLAGAICLLLWRRRHPIWLAVAVLGLHVTAALTSAQALALSAASFFFLFFFTLFSLAARVGPVAGGVGGTAFAAEDMVVSLAGGSVAADVRPAYLITGLIMWALITSVAIQFGNRRRYVAALVSRAQYLESDRDHAARLAAASERARIAREMHDIISHSLAVMVTLSDGAAAVAEKNPAMAAEAMQRVSETGRAAVRDMRRLVGILSPDDDQASPAGADGRARPAGVPMAPREGAAAEAVELAPQPGVADLLALLDTYRAAGLPVTLSVGSAFPDDAVLQLTAYRIVQEALTNALRYAPAGAHVTVSLTSGGHDTFAIDVVNTAGLAGSDGLAEATQRPAPESWEGPGHGIMGMRQRAAMHGGTVEAGPLPGGGWRVHAILHGASGRKDDE